MGLCAASAIGMQSVMIYLLVYLVMNLGAFLVVIVVAQATGSELIDDYKGLGRRHPLSAISFAVFLFSLTGLPPLRDSPASGTCSWRCCRTMPCPGRLVRGPGGDRRAQLGRVALLLHAHCAGHVPGSSRGRVTVRPHLGYQLMLGAFSAALLLFACGGTRWSIGPSSRSCFCAGS